MHEEKGETTTRHRAEPANGTQAQSKVQKHFWRSLFWLSGKLAWLAELPRWRAYIVAMWLPLFAITASLVAVGVYVAFAIVAALIVICLFWRMMLAAANRELDEMKRLNAALDEAIHQSTGAQP